MNEIFLFPATFANSGATETTVTFISGGGYDTMFDPRYRYTYSEWLMGPKSEITFDDFFKQWPQQIRDVYINSKNPFHITGWALYFDKIYGRNRQTRFCVVARDLALDVKHTPIKLSGIAIPCEEKGTNCIDDECPH